MTKKFFKTYYSIPDKQNRIEIVFERGYRNILVLYNGKEVAGFPGAGTLLETKEITTPDGRLIHLKFLKDSTDFEVFFDGIQIDNSETSPQKVINNLKWPIYISMSWYIIVVIASLFYADGAYGMIVREPLLMFTNIGIFYFITSTYLVLIFMIIALFWLNKGNTALYFTAMIIVVGDLVFGTVFQIISVLTFSEGFGFLLIIAFILPLLFKSAAVGAFVRNWNKYKQYANMRSAMQKKINPDLVDL